MSVVTVSRIQGTFLGYAPGVVFRLDDGTEWEQTGNTEEYVYRERPSCRIVFDRERLWIDVEGTSAVAEVAVSGKAVGGNGGVLERFSDGLRTGVRILTRGTDIPVCP